MKTLTVSTKIKGDLQNVWEYYTNPEHITRWNFATPEWQCPRAENDVRVGGMLKSRMEAKDGSMGFDFIATYTQVSLMTHLTYVLEDQRKVAVFFDQDGDFVELINTFEAESSNSLEMQQQGWQAILDNFKEYSEKKFKQLC